MPPLERPHKLNGAQALLSGTAQLLNGARLLPLGNPINAVFVAGLAAILLLTDAVVPSESRTHHKPATPQTTTSAGTTSSRTHKRSTASSSSTATATSKSSSTSTRSSHSSRHSHSTAISASSGTRSSHRRGAQTTVVASSKRGHHSSSSTRPSSSVTTAHERRSSHPEPIVAKHSQAPAEPIADSGEYSSQSKIYALYDQGLNARLVGDYHTSVAKLEELAAMIRDGHLSPTMAAMSQFELGLSAEADNQYQVAIDAYNRSLKLNPRDTNSSLRLSVLLLKTGQPALALVRAKDAVQRMPNDAAAHLALSVALQKNGFSADSKSERERAKQLSSGVGRVPEPAEPIEDGAGSAQNSSAIQPPSSGSPLPGSGSNMTSEGALNDALSPETVPANVP